MNKNKVVVVISARNEEKYITETINSLLSQTIPPKLIVVVDDGSSDDTAKIVSKYKKKDVHLIVREDRIGGPSLLGTPTMVLPFNIGFKYIEEQKIDYDFMMISGADCIYEKEYIEKIITRLIENEKLVVASGLQKGEEINRDHARGAGRIIKRNFWNFYGKQYPYPSYLWESGIIFKAQMIGLEVRGYTDTYYESQRKSGTNINMVRYGRMLRAIGYPLLIVIGRAFRQGVKSGLIHAIRMLAGYFLKPTHKFDADQEIRKYLSKNYLQYKLKYFLRL